MTFILAYIGYATFGWQAILPFGLLGLFPRSTLHVYNDKTVRKGRKEKALKTSLHLNPDIY